jgi:hypothetical protein
MVFGSDRRQQAGKTFLIKPPYIPALFFLLALASLFLAASLA